MNVGVLLNGVCDVNGEEKVRRLRYDRRLSIRTALVYDGHLSASVPADRYFDFIVPADELLLSV